MTNETSWEIILVGNRFVTKKLKIDGGHLYMHERFIKDSIDAHDHNYTVDFQMVFVPDAPNQTTESSDKFDVIFDKLQKLELCLNASIEHFNDRISHVEHTLKARIEKLESENQRCYDADPMSSIKKEFDCVNDRIKSLEQHKNYQIDENRKINNCINALIKEIMYKTDDEEEQLSICEHEWDTSSILLSDPPQLRCKKCQELKVYKVMT